MHVASRRLLLTETSDLLALGRRLANLPPMCVSYLVLGANRHRRPFMHLFGHSFLSVEKMLLLLCLLTPGAADLGVALLA